MWMRPAVALHALSGGRVLAVPEMIPWLLVAVLLIASAAEARDPAQVRAFRATHPCPATGKTTGACPGWVVDHSYPICAGGQDLPSNMQWQETRQSYIKDRIERELCQCRKH